MVIKLIVDNEELNLIEIFEFGEKRNHFNKSYDIKFYDCKNKTIRRFKIDNLKEEDINGGSGR